MTETRILEILAKNLNENTNTTEAVLPPKLRLDSVQCISKNIASTLYDSLTTKNASNENNRLNILLLLQKWCGNSGNHFKIDRNNYDCLINALNACTLVNDEEQTQINLDDCDETFKLDFNVLFMQHYKRMEVINKEKAKSVEIIRNRDRSKCGNDTIFMQSTLHNLKHPELFDNFLQLKQLTDLEGCDEITPVKKANDRAPLKPREPLMRQKQITLAHSVLNLNKSSSDMLLLSNILKNLSAYESLQPCEAQFVDYLWQKSMTEELPFEIPLLLLESFPFVYEKIFVKMCTDALRTSTSQSAPHVSEEVQKIFQLCLKSDRLHNCITNLFYELYACSGFSNKLRCFLILIR